MKWIRYTYVCGTDLEGANIFAEKKVGYNEASIALAQTEAYNGVYTIEEDNTFVPPEDVYHGQWVAPEMYGAIGDGIADDTDAINATLLAGKYIVFAKSYAIRTSENDAEYGHEGYGIVPQSNSTLHFINGARLIGIENNAKRYAVIRCKDVENVRIINPIIECDRTLEDGQHGFGITIRHCKNVVIDGAKITNALGDGIVIGTYQDENESNESQSEDIVIRNSEISHSRRQGITIGGCNRVTIENCYIHDISGADPQAGIDIEPNFSTITCDNIIIRNCRFENNVGNDITQLKGGGSTPVIIEGCTSTGGMFLGTSKYILRDNLCARVIVATTSLGADLDNCTLNAIVTGAPSTLRNCHMVGSAEYDHMLMGTADVMVVNSVFENVCSMNTGTVLATFNGCLFINPNAEKKFVSNGNYLFRHCTIDLGDVQQTITAKRVEFEHCTINYSGQNFMSITDAEYAGNMINNVFNCGDIPVYIKKSTFTHNTCSFKAAKITGSTGIVSGNIHLPDISS